jgi:hypothetical protein
MSNSFDSRCLDLALVFLEDDPNLKALDARELAQEIQECIERWIETQEDTLP